MTFLVNNEMLKHYKMTPALLCAREFILPGLETAVVPEP